MSDCVVLLAHFVLPALTRLCVDVQVDSSKYGSVNHLIQCVAQNAHGPQDTEALQSLFIQHNKERVGIVAWTMPRQDSDDGLRCSIDKTPPARLEFSILWRRRQAGMGIKQYNTLLSALPLNSITSLTVVHRSARTTGVAMRQGGTSLSACAFSILWCQHFGRCSKPQQCLGILYSPH